LKVQDSDTQDKYKFVQKVIRERAFSEAIKKDDDIEAIDFNGIAVESTYDGPRFEDVNSINSEWYNFNLFGVYLFHFRAVQLMEYQKNQKKLHKKYVIQILLKVLDILTALPPLVDEEIPA
jgi:serine/threonine-protein phosphatase 5